MKRNQLLLILIGVLWCNACKTPQKVLKKTTKTLPVYRSSKNDLNISINAIDLSEDMSLLSTKNDEVLILIYTFTNSGVLDSPVLSKELVFDKRIRLKEVEFSPNKNLLKDGGLFFLIEKDSEATIEQLDPIIRIHYQKIIRAFESKDYLEIERYLGDDDLLGVQVIPELGNTPIQLKFSGTHKLDSYDYQITLEQ